jgi:hypothetical protein
MRALLNHVQLHGDGPPNRYSSVTELAEVLDQIHISDIFNVEDDDDFIADDEFTSSILEHQNNSLDDIEFAGSPEFQNRMRQICLEFRDVFRHSVREDAAAVTPLAFTYAVDGWETTANRLPSRSISPEKQMALTEMIDEFLRLGVIRPSTATAWSQVHLVRKPKGGWRFTVDFRGINRVIDNQGWQLPNIKDMLTRIGARRPKIFGAADLTMGYFQMPLDAQSRRATAFVTFRGIYEWTRVPMGILPSANFFQRTMQEDVLAGLLYQICEVYIDDLLIMGDTEEEFCDHLCKVLSRLRDKRVTLNPRKVKLGLTKTEFVGHEIDAEGINMSQKRIENTVN